MAAAEYFGMASWTVGGARRGKEIGDLDASHTVVYHGTTWHILATYNSCVRVTALQWCGPAANAAYLLCAACADGRIAPIWGEMSPNDATATIPAVFAREITAIRAHRHLSAMAIDNASKLMVTLGDYELKIWSIDLENNTISLCKTSICSTDDVGCLHVHSAQDRLWTTIHGKGSNPETRVFCWMMWIPNQPAPLLQYYKCIKREESVTNLGRLLRAEATLRGKSYQSIDKSFHTFVLSTESVSIIAYLLRRRQNEPGLWAFQKASLVGPVPYNDRDHRAPRTSKARFNATKRLVLFTPDREVFDRLPTGNIMPTQIWEQITSNVSADGPEARTTTTCWPRLDTSMKGTRRRTKTKQTRYKAVRKEVSRLLKLSTTLEKFACQRSLPGFAEDGFECLDVSSRQILDVVAALMDSREVTDANVIVAGTDDLGVDDRLETGIRA
ncbi:hypothetical protein SISNIDRAFT_471168 [Sistotremastrum niveocremeum HHB9708]|uniref:WD40 repeat-like protein n=1 Tax=Sistotremastrum niveocremeum HHB9708 TaxID=1314777 RepID=A0A164MXP0_9AGAM|nr:hypothetical protein SISNIDRAFT_471168 [Sistotremastrum niveocremeum HHB9708]